MGACNSVSSIAVHNYHDELNRSSATPTAAVISTTGDLRRCKLPTTASQVLQSEPPQSFICNSDALVYDDFLPKLNPNDELLPDNLYFVLPKTKLRHRLNASDMAALAIRASLALQKEDSKVSGRHLQQILIVNNNHNNNDQSSLRRDNGVTVGGSGLRKKTKSSECNYASSTKTTVTVTYGRSGSVGKFQRMSLKRVKTVVRSSRIRRLSTIDEGSEP